MFEPLWRPEYIDHIQVTAAETVGLGQRGAFYESTGALRDVVAESSLHANIDGGTEPPNSFDAESARSMKQEFLESLWPVRPENVVRGQYAAGEVRGRHIKPVATAPASRPTV